MSGIHSRPNILPFILPSLPQSPTPDAESFLVPAGAAISAALGHRFPVRDPSGQVRVRFIANEGPAFFLGVGDARDVVLVDEGAVFDQGFGVLEIAVDGLDGVVDAGFLLLLMWALVCLDRFSCP